MTLLTQDEVGNIAKTKEGKTFLDQMVALQGTTQWVPYKDVKGSLEANGVRLSNNQLIISESEIPQEEAAAEAEFDFQQILDAINAANETPK